MPPTKVDKQVDIRGQVCPYTLIETRDALKELSKGQVLQVVCDYEPAVETTIPNFCEKKGYPLETAVEGPNLWHLYIQRTD
jgi:TusA-related sulfurtransferase